MPPRRSPDTHSHTHARTQPHMHTHAHARTHTHAHSHTRTQPHTRARHTHTHTHTHGTLPPAVLPPNRERPRNRPIQPPGRIQVGAANLCHVTTLLVYHVLCLRFNVPNLVQYAVVWFARTMCCIRAAVRQLTSCAQVGACAQPVCPAVRLSSTAGDGLASSTAHTHTCTHTRTHTHARTHTHTHRVLGEENVVEAEPSMAGEWGLTCALCVHACP